MRVGVEGSYYLEPSVGGGAVCPRPLARVRARVAGWSRRAVGGCRGRAWRSPSRFQGEVVVEEPPQRFSSGKARKLWWEQVGRRGWRGARTWRWST